MKSSENPVGTFSVICKLFFETSTLFMEKPPNKWAGWIVSKEKNKIQS